MSKKRITIPIFIPHLGCPHQCAFCNQWETSGSRVLPDKKSIDEQVVRYLSQKGADVEHIEIAFFGGSFTGIPIPLQEELLSAAGPYLEKNIIQGIRLSTRPDYINEQALLLLKKYSVTTIELGIQSFFDDVLSASNRGHSARDSHQAPELVKKHGFDVVIQLMPGLPGDSREKSIQSAEIAAEYTPAGVRIYPTVVLNNTKLAHMYKNNEYSPLSTEEAVERCKDMYMVFQRNTIPVIRMGLHPLNPEERKNILAGPYHPSFGFMVKSRMRRDIIEEAVKDLIHGKPGLTALKIEIPDRNKEEYIGTKKENIEYIKQRFNLKKVEYFISADSSIRITHE
ncbi:MAG: radical SAM protein [bacterium]|nr:radical SAM protein [bacterium]